MKKLKLLIIGGGYLGERLVKHYRSQYDLHVITRTLHKSELWSSLGVKHSALDITHSKFTFSMKGYDKVILNAAVTVDRAKTNAHQTLYVKGTLNLLRCLKHDKFSGQLIIIGSTGLMQPNDGPKNQPEFSEYQTFNEESLAQYHPSNPTPSYEQYQIWENEKDTCGFQILFLASAGIYGPGRVPGLRVVQGLRVTTKNPQKLINFIHIEDLTRAIIFISEKLRTSDLLFISDGRPQKLLEMYHLYSKLLGVPEVEFKKPDSPSDASDKGKWIQNQKLLNLGFSLKHPSFSESLDNILNISPRPSL